MEKLFLDFLDVSGTLYEIEDQKLMDAPLFP